MGNTMAHLARTDNANLIDVCHKVPRPVRFSSVKSLST
jgi:hypothetical protein